MSRSLQAPFPYFGGKSAVAQNVWDALGNPKHYIEPFFGSGAVLLMRPNPKPWRHIETVCDKDGLLANVWRALRIDPDGVAEICDWPVNHADLNARRKVLNARQLELLDKLIEDDKYFDVELAGYWIWAASCWIGHGLACPNAMPYVGKGGMGVHKIGKRPHLSNSGMGVHKIGQIPEVGHAGKGVHKIGKTPHVSDANNKSVSEPYNINLYKWFRELSERLRYVRVVCGDWTRVCGGNWQDKCGTCGIFFDPPYGEKAQRAENLYSEDSLSVADDVRKWCLERGERETYRIVLAGYYEEHESLLEHGWTVKRWKAQGGYGNLGSGKVKENRHREALFMSPYCTHKKRGLFA
jgi:DNA adenine methylase